MLFAIVLKIILEKVHSKKLFHRPFIFSLEIVGRAILKMNINFSDFNSRIKGGVIIVSFWALFVYYLFRQTKRVIWNEADWTIIDWIFTRCLKGVQIDAIVITFVVNKQKESVISRHANI